MLRAKVGDIINKVCLTTGEVSEVRRKAFEGMLSELRYLENACIRHLANGCSYERVGKILEIPVSYVKYQERKAIRHLRSPKRYYTLLLGSEEYAKKLESHTGVISVDECGFTTKTTNTLKRNGFEYVEELDSYIGGVPERFAYIEGLGKYGMSEVLFYYANRGSED